MLDAPLISEPPNVRLQLASRPENVMLVREVLYGVGKAIALDALVLNDVRTAVTEACNNVVLHAYEGGEGPLEVEISASAGGLAVVVRDRGSGIRPQIRSLPDGLSGLGLLVIQALADRVAYQDARGADDAGPRGTEVCMLFATPGTRALGQTHFVDGYRRGAARRVGGGEAGLASTMAVWIRPADLAREILPRLLSALAARARFSTDRVSDARLLANALAARACESDAQLLDLAVTVADRDLLLQIASPAGGADGRLALEPALSHLGPHVQLLADDRALTSSVAPELALRLVDDR